MKYLLNRDVLGAVMLPAPPPALLRRIAAVPPGEQATSSVVLGELLSAVRSGGTVCDPVAERMEQAVRGHLAIVPFDERAARAYGELRAQLQAQGQHMVETDIQTAAVALANSLIVVTGDSAPFVHVPLAVEDWFA